MALSVTILTTHGHMHHNPLLIATEERSKHATPEMGYFTTLFSDLVRIHEPFAEVGEIINEERQSPFWVIVATGDFTMRPTKDRLRARFLLGRAQLRMYRAWGQRPST